MPYKARSLFGRMSVAAMLALTLLLAAGLLAGSTAIVEQESDPRAGIKAFEPSAEHPYGRPHPDAPPELAQMAFMIGDFDCTDRSLQRDGTWKEMKTIWGARYFLNGHAIHDQHWKQGFTNTNLRLFDAKRGKWVVSWLRMPPYGQNFDWIGAEEGEGADRKMVMRKEATNSDGQTTLSLLTFYDITANSYKWKMERFRDGEMLNGGPVWRISCQRGS